MFSSHLLSLFNIKKIVLINIHWLVFSYVFQQIDNFIKKHRRGQQFVEAPMLLCQTEYNGQDGHHRSAK